MTYCSQTPDQEQDYTYISPDIYITPNIDYEE